EADVAADRERGHAARATRPARVRRELGALRVVGGDADPGEHDEDEAAPVAWRIGRERDSDPREADAYREQPDRAAPVGPEAEEWLDEGRRDGRGEHERRGER